MRENIELNGNKYRLAKQFVFNNKQFVEFRCEEAASVKFYQIQNGDLLEITDMTELTNAIKSNYVVEE